MGEHGAMLSGVLPARPGHAALQVPLMRGIPQDLSLPWGARRLRRASFSGSNLPELLPMPQPPQLSPP